MQTTSLEVSRELEKAGFWEDGVYQRTPSAIWLKGQFSETWNIVTWAKRADSGRVYAATYDDLILALGLDKPNKDYSVSDDGCGGWTYYFDITVRDRGFIPDVLADVWLDLKRRGCRNPAEVFPILDTWDKPSTWDKKGHKDGD
ncbi:hypothetical protein KAR91_13910 [Candidatus Pacearchaeota archaeon]|nr:hypothetical protein [Candidatus Pacearchaeota archaeon]